MQRVFLLGVPIDPVTRTQALLLLQKFLEEPRAHHVTTPNSEMLVEAYHHPPFREVLCSSHLNLPDSAGLLFMARWTGQRLPQRVTGVDTVEALLRILDQRHPIFLLGAGEGVAERAADALREKNPRLNMTGTYAGSPSVDASPAILERIRAASPHVLLVAYGAPVQDLWIANYLPELPSVRLAMGVGGTFDFLAGVRRRAPRILRMLGLEWAWRLLLEPSRIRRIWRAIVVFPMLVFLNTRAKKRRRLS